MRAKIQRFIKEEAGASAVEYGLLVALIAVTLIAAMTALSGGIQNAFNEAATQMNSSS